MPDDEHHFEGSSSPILTKVSEGISYLPECSFWKYFMNERVLPPLKSSTSSPYLPIMANALSAIALDSALKLSVIACILSLQRTIFSRPGSPSPMPLTAILYGSLNSSEPRRSSWGTLFQSRPSITASSDSFISQSSSSALSSREFIRESTAMVSTALSLSSTL